LRKTDDGPLSRPRTRRWGQATGLVVRLHHRWRDGYGSGDVRPLLAAPADDRIRLKSRTAKLAQMLHARPGGRAGLHAGDDDQADRAEQEPPPESAGLHAFRRPDTSPDQTEHDRRQTYHDDGVHLDQPTFVQVPHPVDSKYAESMTRVCGRSLLALSAIFVVSLERSFAQ
jgi:hypothetical protein